MKFAATSYPAPFNDLQMEAPIPVVPPVTSASLFMIISPTFYERVNVVLSRVVLRWILLNPEPS